MPTANNTPTPKAAGERTLGGFLRWSATTVFCGAVLLGTARRSAAATTLTVNTVSDAPAHTGISLRDAVNTANTSAGPVAINFNLPPGSIINLTQGELAINETPATQTISITGPGATNLTINQTTSNRIFNVYAPYPNNNYVTSISGLTIAYGRVTDANGGGILNNYASILKLDGMVIRNCSVNSSLTGIPHVKGGGIFNSSFGNITLTNSTVAGCTVIGKFQGGGAGIYNVGSVNLVNSTISNCSTDATGGAIYGAQYSSNTIIKNSTISGNYGKSGGGGIYALNPSTLLFQNSTIVYNRTVANGGGILSSGTQVLFLSSILSGNTTIGNTPNDCNVTGATLNAYNSLIQAPTGNFSGNYGPGPTPYCIFSQPANLAPLAYNGGPTQTHKPNALSPVLGGGYNAAGATTDQRGAPRSVAGKVDMGAVQIQPAQALVVTNANDNGPGSLRAAASSAFDAPSTVTFSNYFSTPRTIALTSGEIPVSGLVTITGPGAANATVDAGNASRIFNIRGSDTASIAISGLTVMHGSHNSGGGIFSNTNLSLDSVVVSNCSATGIDNQTSGGGVSIQGNAALSLSIRNSTIAGNSIVVAAGNNVRARGAGIYSDFTNSRMQNSTISGNTITITGTPTGSCNADGGGLGFYNGGKIQNSTVSGNSITAPVAATAGGAGIYSGGAIALYNSTIVNNSVDNASGFGGGILAINPLAMTSTIVAKNTHNSAAPVNDDVSAGTVSGTNNLIGDGSGETGLSNGTAGNRVGSSAAPIDPMILPLANNGGATQTHVLLFGSPAIDTGLDTTDIFGAAPLLTDQRGAGFPRQIGTGVDIGAIEHDQTPPVAVLTAAPNVTFPPGPYLFSVTFTDNKAVDVATIANTNILVTGPGFSQLATIFSIVPNVSGPSIVVTYKIVPPNNVWGIAQNGVFTISILANQVRDNEANPVAPGNLGTFTVSIPVPQFISAPTATPSTGIIGQNVQFTALVNGLGPITYNWNFGDGTSGTGNPIAHVFTAAGTYTVVLTAVDSQGVPLQQTFTIIIIDPNADSDGDGVTNDVEVALGSDPLSAASTPFNIGKITSKVPLKLKKLKIQLSFGRGNADVISASGQVTAPPSLLGQTMIFNIGHIVKAFTLDKRGAAIQSVGKTGLLNDKVRVSKRGAFTLSLARGAYQSFFTSDTDPARNLTSAQGTSKTRTVSVTVYFNNTAFQIDFTGPYKASAGKFGK